MLQQHQQHAFLPPVDIKRGLEKDILDFWEFADDVASQDGAVRSAVIQGPSTIAAC